MALSALPRCPWVVALGAAFLLATPPAKAAAPLRMVTGLICNALGPGQDLQFVDYSLSSLGLWGGGSDTIPADPSNNCGIFSAFTIVPFIGLKGSVTYEIDNWTGSGSGQITFGFDNPWSGSNSYPVSAPTGLLITVFEGSGDIANVTYWVQYANASPAPIPEPSADRLLAAALGFMLLRRRHPGR
jgi:hypothetical protein